MAPIPVYNNSPIAAVKPDGVTPKTASATDGQGRASGASSPQTTSTSTYTPPKYGAATSSAASAAAQPGATPSLPAHTSPAAAKAYLPPQPTPMTSMAGVSPAPPQPGSVPVSSLPPPPRAGEKYQPPVQTPAPPPTSFKTVTRYPPQMAIPTPTVPQPSSQRGTSTAPIASYSPRGAQAPPVPMGLGGEGAHSLSHPTGYQQDVNASRLDQYQKSAMERPLDDTGNDLDGVWGVAKKLAQQTGERLATAESELWKKINNR
ncbi:hypothetical protein F4861DRAFT_537269 [Xylaria intraflava]|nr:hypothetical protein F4861DRAFT_537269 [Xylaria intraflava]